MAANPSVSSVPPLENVAQNIRDARGSQNQPSSADCPVARRKSCGNSPTRRNGASRDSNRRSELQDNA